MLKNIDRWIGSYVGHELRKMFLRRKSNKPTHILFCCVDHFEPDWNTADVTTQNARVQKWVTSYPTLARKFRDADGCFPKHTFFYPAECYTKDHLDMLSEICRQDFGEVEIHLHHDNDTEEGLRQKLEKAKKDFSSHGFLGRRSLSGQIRFAFIHGNWALNNSRSDGRWCGVNDETRLLAAMGCYADFTYPSAPSETQTKTINRIYYAKSHKEKPKSHNKGKEVQVGKAGDGDLILIQGPLTLNWKQRKWGLFPKIENSELSYSNPPTEKRADLWIQQKISVREKPEWIFVKVHTHGAVERNAAVLLGEPMQRLLGHLEKNYNDGKQYVLHYVTAREMYNIVKAAEAGEGGSPHKYRNYVIGRNDNES